MTRLRCTRRGGTFCPKTTEVDEKIVALLTPQFQPLTNEYDSSAPYYLSDTESQILSEDAQVGTSQDFIVNCNVLVPAELPTLTNRETSKRPISPLMKDVETTPKIRKTNLTETKKKNINNLSASIIKRKNQKQINEDAITAKRLEILEIQRQQELLKLEKTKILMDLDIELKKKSARKCNNGPRV